jgi:hypothetical protein
MIPVITGATGTISKSLGGYLTNIPGKHEINPYPAKVENMVSS